MGKFLCAVLHAGGIAVETEVTLPPAVYLIGLNGVMPIAKHVPQKLLGNCRVWIYLQSKSNLYLQVV